MDISPSDSEMESASASMFGADKAAAIIALAALAFIVAVRFGIVRKTQGG